MALTSCGSVVTDPQGRELIEHGTPLFPVACYHDNISETDVPWHWHDELEGLAVETGTARVAANGTDHIVKRGEGFFVNTGVLHGAWPEGAEICRLRSIVFHPRLVGGSVDSILWQKYLEPLLTDPCRSFVHFTEAEGWEREAACAIREAWQICVDEEPGFEFGVREQLSRLILLLFQNGPAAEKKPSEKALRDGERIKTMLHYIQEHYAEELTLSKIAQSAAVSENECLRCFRSMIGSTPIQYVKQVRIQRAAELLTATDRTVSDIGGACGFQEMSYFAKTFRELKGCTPKKYRAMAALMPRASRAETS